MVLPILALGGMSLALSWLLTAAMIRIAPRVGLVDKPGHRKIHDSPKPLGGGVAVFLSLAAPLVGALIAVHCFDAPAWLNPPYWSGARKQTPLALGLIGGMLVLHVLGLIDDRKALGPYIKLVAQIVTAGALVIGLDMRALTAFGYAGSVALTILWIVGITNAFNFLDNMDGLSAGVGAVCATAFLVTALYIQQWFVAAALAVLLGSLLGFLFWNFPPAKIFMGDSGSLVIGFVLAVLTVRTTYLRPGEDFAAGWYSVFAPVIVLAVPLYDLIVVSLIRISRGKSPFVGDTNHFSHRLVARGMSRRTAVLCIYLVTAATASAAILLPHVHSQFAALLIFVQTLLVLGVVAVLEFGRGEA
ncbi:MAG: glycosyltransferase family 4 protein [Tepidisphaeraceae bacterium]